MDLQNTHKFTLSLEEMLKLFTGGLVEHEDEEISTYYIFQMDPKVTSSEVEKDLDQLGLVVKLKEIK